MSVPLRKLLVAAQSISMHPKIRAIVNLVQMVQTVGILLVNKW